MKGKNEMNNKKSSKRKFLAATLGALIVVNIVSVCDFSVVKFGDFSANLSNSDVLTVSMDELDDETVAEFERRAVSCIENFEKEADISDLVLSSDVSKALMSEFLAKHPEYSYIKHTFGGGFFNGNNELKYAKTLKISYKKDADVIKAQRAKLDEYTNAIVEKAADMTDLEKALYVHDRIAIDFAYDSRTHSSDPDVKGQAVFNILDFVEQRTGVCEAYSKLYMYILTKLGVPARIATSSFRTDDAGNTIGMGHAWNVVQINGNWYHVDLTWDDPEPDTKGNVTHEYFLLSDSKISSMPNPHKDWTFLRNEDVSCSDTSFDSAWWTDVSTEIFYINNKWFTMKDNGEFIEVDIKSGDSVQKAETAFAIEADKWYYYGSDQTYWIKNYTALVNNGDEIFYNTSENVYSINIDGTNKRLVASFPKADHDGFLIYGLAVDENNMLYVNLQNNPQETTDSEGNVIPVSVKKYIISDVSTASSMGVAVEDDVIKPSTGKNESSEAPASPINFIDWKEIKDIIKSETSVEITMPDKENSLPAEIVANVMGKDINIVIDMDTYKWTINGMDVSSGNIADVALGVSENLGIVPASVNDMYIDDQKTVEVNLDHEGQFGYDATLSIYVGKEYASKIASVLHYKEDTNVLDYQDSVIIDDEGYANITICHASSYMIVVDDKIVGLPGDINADGTADLKDFVTLKQYLVGRLDDVSELKIANTDMNSDGRVSINDAVLFGRELIANK